MATEAEIEKAVAAGLLAGLEVGQDASRASLSRSLRFFAGGQANALVVAAHGLANLTLRTLALDPGFAVEDVKPRRCRRPTSCRGRRPRARGCR